MDLNQLYHDHQVALLRAAGTSDRSSQLGFCDTARALGRDILAHHHASGAPAAAQWHASGRQRHV